MRWLYLLIFMTFLLLLLSGMGLTKEKPIIVAGGDKFIPFIYLNAQSEPDGIDVDLWRLWSRKSGVEIELKLMDWATAIPALLEGKVDVVDGVTYTPERAEYLDFSSQYGEINVYIYFHESIGGIRGLHDLEGFPVGVVQGTNLVEFVTDEAPGVRLVPYINHEQMVHAALGGGLRVFLGEDPVIPYFFAKAGQRGGFRRSHVPLVKSELRMAVRKGDSGLLNIINKGLGSITAAENEKILRSWTGMALTSRIPWKWLTGGAGAVFMFVVLLITWNALLRKRVSKATRTLRDSEEKYRIFYEKSRRAEELYRSLLDTSADAIILYDLEGKVIYLNPIFTKTFGWKLEELEGKHVQFVPDSEKTATMSGIKQIVEEGKPIQGFETKRYTNEGQIIDVSISGSRYHDHEGKPTGMLVILRDITEKKRLEAQFQQTKKMEAMGLLAGGVAHDLNNILSGIVSYPELILLDLPEGSKLRKPIETIQQSGHRATAIVQDLLTIARGVAITKEPLNLNDLISDYLDSPEFRKLKQFHPTVIVKTKLDRDLLNIGGSYVHIRKVVMNLVANASEAIEGSGHVTISTMNRYIDRPVRGYDDVNEGEYVVLAVSDNGSGISSGDFERIFEPFYTKKVMGRSGTGLGLAVVWNVVQDHQGYIDFKSDEYGTIFDLYFPITRNEISDKALSIPIKDYKGKGETILVVDDVESQREISCEILDTLGYKSNAVSSGEEAVEYLKENSVDLLLLDMIMDPGINGRETYERIIKIHPNQKAIIVSGFAETDEIKEAQKLGAGQYIKKPLTLEKIGLAVKEELEK